MKTLKIFSMLTLLLFAVTMVSAFEFDNVKSYDSVTREVTINNCDMWIGTCLNLGEEIGKAKLLTPLNVRVGTGYQKVAMFEIEAYEDYNDAIKQFTFTDMNKKEKINRDFDLKMLSYEIVEVDDYGKVFNGKYENGTKVYDWEIIGSHTEEKEVWEKVTPADLKKNEKLTIGIFTNVEFGDYVDWIPTIYGVEVEEWATWEAYLNTDLEAFYFLDGNVTDALGNYDGTNNGVNFTSGNKGQAGDFENGETDYISVGDLDIVGNSFTFNAWVKMENTGVTKHFIGKYNAGDVCKENGQFFLDTAEQYAFTHNDGTWHSYYSSGVFYGGGTDWTMVTMTIDGTNLEVYENGVSVLNLTIAGTLCGNTANRYIGYDQQGGASGWDGLMDDVAFWSRPLNDSEIRYIYDNNVSYGDTDPSDNGPNITLNYPTADANYTSDQSITFNFTASDDIKLDNVTFYVNGVLNQTNSSGLNNTNYYFDLSLSDGDYTINGIATDNNTNSTNSSSIRIFIDSTKPQIDIESPSGETSYGTIGENVTLNFTVTEDFLDSCWYNYNGTNISVPGCLNATKNSTIFLLENRPNQLTVYSNDTSGNENSSTTTWNYTVLQTELVYEATAYETSTSTFSINYTYTSTDWTSSSARLVYNGTEYISTSSGTGNSLKFSYDKAIPVVSSDVNVTFYWKLSLTNSTGTYNFTSASYNQTVSRVNFELCNYSAQPQLFFQTFDTLSPTSSLNATFSSAWTISDANGGGTVLSRSYEDLSETNSTWAFCIQPNSTNYTVSVDITVDAANYTPTTHFIVDTDYTHSTNNITIYLLHDDDSTLTKLVVKDQNNAPVQGVYTTIQKYDVGTDTYYNVGMTRSDSNGEDLAYLAWYDYWYKFVGVKDGAVVFTEGPKKISETPQTFYTDSSTALEYEKYNNIQYSLVYNNVTENFVLTYVDPSGEVAHSCLRVLKRTLSEEIEICDTCESSTSATIYCNVANSGNGTFLASYYAYSSPRNYIDTIVELVNVQAKIYDSLGNSNATGMAILLAGIILSLFLVTPGLGILGACCGMVAAVALGFQPLDYFTLIGITVVGGGLMMWAVQR